MYKQKSKNPPSTPLGLPRPSSPNTHNTRNRPEISNHSSAIDLHKFNDYLQDRISRSALRKQPDISRGDSSQKRTPQAVPSGQPTPPASLLRSHALQNFKESRIKKTIQQPSWRKHESIQNLLNKQNHFYSTEHQEHRKTTECQSQQALRQLERKYQQLQDKYKALIKHATENARSFEKDKQELNQLKHMHREDQQVLGQLKEELNLLHENVSQNEGGHGHGHSRRQTINQNQNQSSVVKVKSEGNFNLGASRAGSEEKRRGKGMAESREGKEQAGEGAQWYHNRTSENWTSQLDKNKRALFQPDQKARTQQGRYYSAQKQPDLMRKSTKPKKSSDHTQYSTSKYNESMRASRAGQSKPVTETCIRLDNQFSSKNTPTTLQKKMITPKPYSKYRFQPSYKIE